MPAPETPPQPSGFRRSASDAPVRALLVALGFPWTVHAAAVGLSAAGIRPFEPVPSTLILVSALVISWELARRGAPRFAELLPRAGTPGASVAAYERDAVDEPGAGARRREPAALRFFTTAMAAAAAIALTGALAAAIALPVVAYDALAYRLPTIASWLDEGRIAWVTTDDPVRNGYPMGQEAVSAVIAAATGSMRFVAVPSFFYVAAGALSIWLLSEACGVRRLFARTASATFVLVPMVLLNAPSGYVDAAFAGATVSLFCLTALAMTSEHGGVFLALAMGMAAANALSLKGTGLFFVAIAATAALGAALAKRRVTPVAIAAAFTLPGSFWAVRNVLRTGNPIWPVEVRVAGHVLFHGVGPADRILDVAHNTPPAFASMSELGRIAHTWLELAGPARDFDDRTAGFGLAWALVALPAVVALIVVFSRERRRELVPILVVVALTAVCFALQPMRWWPRYSLWVWGAGALALGAMAERLHRRHLTGRLVPCLALLSFLSVGEGFFGLAHANGAIRAWSHGGDVHDPMQPSNVGSWIDPTFWRLGIAGQKIVCRGDWKPGTDNGNLDGVLAQMTPRPRVHLVSDDSGSWPRVRESFRNAGCADLLLFRGSPVLPLAAQDTQFSVEAAVAFDPLFVVRPRSPVLLGQLDRRPP